MAVSHKNTHTCTCRIFSTKATTYIDLSPVWSNCWWKLSHLSCIPIDKTISKASTWVIWCIRSSETQPFGLDNNKENTKCHHYLPFVSIISRWSVFFIYKVPVLWKVYPCHDVIRVRYSPRGTSNYIPQYLWNGVTFALEEPRCKWTTLVYTHFINKQEITAI